MNFKEAKRLFRDEIDISLYVPLFQKIEIDLSYAIYEKEKMILISGEAGSGKSFLIKRVYEKIKSKEENFQLYFISNPFEEEEIIDYLFLVNDSAEHKIVFIDEAQALSAEKVERLRILADNQQYTVILAIHEKEAKDIYAKKHFQTRINYFIHLKPLNVDKIELFINSKLMQSGAYEIASLFTKSNYKLIYKLTKGNLREINRLVYKILDILEYLQENSAEKLSEDKIENKHIQMAQMSLEDLTYSYEELEKLYNKNKYLRFAIIGGVLLSLVAILAVISMSNPSKKSIEDKSMKVETPKQPEKLKIIMAKKVEKNITTSVVPPQIKVVNKPKVAVNKPKSKPVLKPIEKLFIKPIYPKIDTLSVVEQQEVPSSVKKVKKLEKVKKAEKLAKKVIKKEVKKQITPPIKIVITSTPDKLKNLEDLYNNSPQYDLAIKITKLYFNKGEYDKSIEWAKKANKLSPENYESWYIFAQSLIKLGSQKKAKSVLVAYLNTYGADKHIEKLLRSIK